jgi:HRDC domain
LPSSDARAKKKGGKRKSFHNSTLLAMATDRPRDLYAFARLRGVGGAKLSRYAQTFLAIIAAHMEKDLVAPEGAHLAFHQSRMTLDLLSKPGGLWPKCLD